MNKGLPINAGHVHDDVDHVAAQFITLHVHRGAVCGDIDLAHHVKQECFLYPRILKQTRDINCRKKKKLSVAT